MTRQLLTKKEITLAVLYASEPETLLKDVSAKADDIFEILKKAGLAK